MSVIEAEGDRLVLPWPALVATLLVTTFAFALIGVQPIFAGILANAFSLDVNAVGYLLGVEQGGGVCGTILGFWLLRSISASRLAMAAAAIAIGVSIATAYAPSAVILAVLRFLYGCSSALAYTVGVYVLGRSINPDRSFGIMLVLQTILWSIYSVMLPTLVGQHGNTVAICSSAIWVCLVFVLAFLLPSSISAERDAQQRTSAPLPRTSKFALLGMLLFQVGIFCQWGFLERVGSNASLDPNTIGWAFGIGVLGGIPGGILPAMIGERITHRAAIYLGTAVVLAGNLIFALSPAPVTHFLFAVFLLNLGWVFALTYYMGYVAVTDTDGRTTRLIPFAQAIGPATGPLLIALFVSGSHMALIFAISAGFIVGGSIILWMLADGGTAPHSGHVASL